VEEKQFKYFDIIMAFFVMILVVSNIASSAKIVDLKANLFGLQLAFDGGTILFPLSYIFGDILTEVYGYKLSRRVIWTGFAALAGSSLVFWGLGLLPGESQWQTYAGDHAYAAILGGMSSGGIVLGSLAGFWSGEFSNSVILARLKVITEGKMLWLRTISSTLVGQMIDTVVFVTIASLFGVFPWSLFWTLTVSNYLFKVGIEVIMTPLTYKLVTKAKSIEKVDHYDRDTDFNPFLI